MDATRVCSIDGCGRPHIARSWCTTHYARWRKYGDPNAVLSVHYETPEEAFNARTARDESGCLVWTGGKEPRGYGVIRANGKSARAHRYAWERVNGPIPDGMFIDHTCWNKSCCEVSHLRLATQGQNNENLKPGRANNTSGARGVGFHKPSGKWRARVNSQGKPHFVGSFDTIEEAAIAAETARASLHTHSQN